MNSTPPYAPISRAATPLCVEPKRTLSVDDGTDAIGGETRQIAEFPDTKKHKLTAQIEKAPARQM